MHDTKYSAHYISGTHWDREWYRPFQEFRVLLVELLDDLLAIMERDPEFKYFQLDGQTCILDDYLEIRPENRERIGKLMRDGRILAGPWFTMPDLFCVGDEALVRNLLMGRRICHEWDIEPMPVGFICDMFGHPSQIPQIFAGFDIHDVVLGRGTNEHTTDMFFEWEAPDGTRAFTFKLQDRYGYGAFAIPRSILEKPMFFTNELKEFVAEMEAATNEEEQNAVKEKYFCEELAKYVRHEAARSKGDVLCLMDSMDHIPPATEVPRYLRLISESCPEVEPQHSNLPAFFAEAREKTSDLQIKKGELREPARGNNSYLYLIPFCVSARVRMKQANDYAQNLLEKYVEPMMALANLRGAKIPEKYLEVAWRNVLLNHAHDSICGCSIDQVHRDMMYRFDQARTMGETLRAQCLEVLTQDAPELARQKDEFTLVLFNALPEPRSETVRFHVDLPPDYATEFKDGFFTQAIKAFRLETADGKEVSYHRLAFEPHSNERSQLPQFCFQTDGEFVRYHLAAQLELPAMGYTTLRVKPSQTPVRVAGSLRTGPTAAENEHLGIAIDSNGTLTLTDKASGQTYTDLLLWEDRSEIGDGWYHAHSVNDEQILSNASRAQVALVHEGPELVTFKSTITLDVPKRYDWHTESRMPERVPLEISSLITLRRGAHVVEVETSVNNIAEDHRLRLLLPSDAEDASTFFAHHPYDFVERPIALDQSTHDWQEMEVSEKPFLHAQAVGDGERGLAFISEGGLHEGGVMDDQRRTMQVTILRSFRKTVATGGESEGLEQGEIKVRYVLMPFAGELPRTEIMREIARLQTKVLSRQTGTRPSGFPALTGSLASDSLLQVEGNLVVSAIKPSENGEQLVVRLWNPYGETQTAEVRTRQTIKSVRYLKLNEEIDDCSTIPQFEDSLVFVEAAPHRIVTIGLEIESQ